jgi:hypothetical protein
VFIEFNPKTFLCVANPPQGSHGNHELAVAKGANPDGWDCAKPFGHSKIACRHADDLPQTGLIAERDGYAAQRRSRSICGTVGRQTGALQFG